MNIGFIGLGSMGTPMARNLIKAGHKLTVYNRTRSRAEALQREGARVADTPADAAADVEACITMLADDTAIEAVVFSDRGVLAGLKRGATHICMSTISVALSQRLTKAHREKLQHYVAATVFGRPEAAAAAKLFVVAAGPVAHVKTCQPVFDAVGQRTFEVGEEPYASNVVKLAGNFLITAVIEALAESIALVRKHGLDPKTFMDLLTNSLFAAPVYRNYGAMIAADHFEPVGFKMPLGLKDNRLLLAAAEQAGVPMPLASLVRDRFVTAIAQGLGESDWAAIARISYREAGLKEPA